jgi:L-alanine-DL-glutamate epimerase-like enolase superfamily enzyme
MNPSNIRYASAFALKIPLIKPMLMAGTHITHAETLIVRIESHNGHVGWGENTAAPSHGGQTLEDMSNAFNHGIKDSLIGVDSRNLSAIGSALSQKFPKGSGAIAAIDMALYDLVGKEMGVAAYTLMGGKRRYSVPPLWLIGTKSVESDISEAKKYQALGYQFFKLKLGVKSVQEDIQSAVGIRQALGNDIQICADANMGYSTEDAIEFLEGTREAKLAFLEQPLAKDNLAGLQRICELNIAPIGLDESITSIADMIESKKYGVSGVSLKTLKLGGISGVLRSAIVCDAFGLQINLAGKIAESSVASAAVLQLSAALNEVNWGISPSHLYLAEDIVDKPITPTQGVYIIPNQAGLGVEVNETKLKHFAV